MVSIRGGRAHVDPGNTHHLCIFETTDKKGRTKRVMRFTTMLEAANRLRNRQTVIVRVHPEHPEARFLMSLCNYDLVLLEHNKKQELYRLETSASTEYRMWFRHHTFAGKSTDNSLRVSKSPGTFRGKKVTVDLLGRIRNAND
jgi:hypothetical protein